MPGRRDRNQRQFIARTPGPGDGALRSAHHEIEASQEGDDWGQLSKYQPNGHVGSESGAATPNPIVVLILWLGHLSGLLFWQDCLQGVELEEVNVASKVQSMENLSLAQQRYFSYHAILVTIVSQNSFVLAFFVWGIAHLSRDTLQHKVSHSADLS